ncbi:MAG: hypothetical protein Q7V17_10030 [Afipia sp.]|nr:hypothetical protein [Afipia sp.]
MLRWIFDLSRVRRARKAACAVLSPMVAKSRHRLGAIPDVAWSSPYIVGFMVMLITIIAKIEIGKIGGQTLCLVQAKAWEDITAMRSNLIGEEVLLLSAARNRDFEIGCQNAMTLGSMLIGNSILKMGLTAEWQDQNLDLRDGATAIWSERDDVSSLWERFFDAHVSVHICDIETGLGKSPFEYS